MVLNTRSYFVKSLPCCGRLLGGVDKLPYIRPLLVEICHMLRAQLLVCRKLLLRAIFLSSMDVGLSETVVAVREVSVEFQSLRILRDRVAILALIRIQVAKLQVCFG